VDGGVTNKTQTVSRSRSRCLLLEAIYSKLTTLLKPSTLKIDNDIKKKAPDLFTGGYFISAPLIYLKDLFAIVYR
jgi:hypothetical protein